jgi:hypothetical protein
MCTVLLPPGVNLIAVNKYVNIQVTVIILGEISHEVMEYGLNYSSNNNAELSSAGLKLSFTSISNHVL